MEPIRFAGKWLVFTATTIIFLAGNGCRSMRQCDFVQSGHAVQPVHGPVPRELSKVILPTYTIEPPDILMIDAIHIVPRSPYFLKTGDVLNLHVRGALPDAPIEGAYAIAIGGQVNLGYPYGPVKVTGMTLEDAKTAIEDHLDEFLKEPFVVASLIDISAKQQIAGEHLVAPDGTVTLGSYGSVQVVGQTIAQAKQTIENYLSQFLEAPEVSVDVFAYNSKVYYVITQGAGLGDGVYRFPITGNETVLDAIAQINGLEGVSSKQIWIARPTGESEAVQVLPVSWNAITAQACTATNYQILPGDRVFIAEDRLIAFDNHLAKIIAPLERIMGFSLLGASTATRLSGSVLRGGGNPRGGGF